MSRTGSTYINVLPKPKPERSLVRETSRWRAGAGHRSSSQDRSPLVYEQNAETGPSHDDLPPASHISFGAPVCAGEPCMGSDHAAAS
jgi:hypothetical protein